MKRIRNLMIMVLALIGLTSVGLLNVNASAPSSVTIKSKSSLYYYTEKKGTDYISGYNFYRKELTDGKMVYCVSNINTSVPAGLTLSLRGEISDPGLDYIIRNGYPYTNDLNVPFKTLDCNVDLLRTYVLNCTVFFVFPFLILATCTTFSTRIKSPLSEENS